MDGTVSSVTSDHIQDPIKAFSGVKEQQEFQVHCVKCPMAWKGLNSQGQVFGHQCMECLQGIKRKTDPHALPSLGLHCLLCVICN